MQRSERGWYPRSLLGRFARTCTPFVPNLVPKGKPTVVPLPLGVHQHPGTKSADSDRFGHFDLLLEVAIGGFGRLLGIRSTLLAPALGQVLTVVRAHQEGAFLVRHLNQVGAVAIRAGLVDELLVRGEVALWVVGTAVEHVPPLGLADRDVATALGARDLKQLLLH